MTDFLHANIPMTQHAGLRVLEFDPRVVRIAAPLAPNRNHHETAFGGSLAMIAVVSGWTLAHANLLSIDCEATLVVQHSAMDFVAPGRSGLLASSEVDEAARLEFLDAIQRRGRARLEIRTDIRDEQHLAVRHRARYAALPKKETA